MTEDVEVPSKFRLWREAQGWSQTEVADLTGLAVSTIHQFERGTSRLAPETKVRIARRLRARVQDLFDPEEVDRASIEAVG